MSPWPVNGAQVQLVLHDVGRVRPHGGAVGTGRWRTEATLGSELSSLVGRINKASFGIPLFFELCGQNRADFMQRGYFALAKIVRATMCLTDEKILSAPTMLVALKEYDF